MRVIRATARGAAPAASADRPIREVAISGVLRGDAERCAIAAASARLAAPSLARMRETCTITVFSLMNSVRDLAIGATLGHQL